MEELFKYLEQNFYLVFGIAFSWVIIGAVASIIYRVIKKDKLAKILKDDLKFSEKMASGHSLKNWFTKIGGARNCLSVQVSNEGILIKPIFPFDLMFIPEVFDLEHFIANEKIINIKDYQNKLLINFEAKSGTKNSLELRLKHHQEFIDVISKK